MSAQKYKCDKQTNKDRPSPDHSVCFSACGSMLHKLSTSSNHGKAAFVMPHSVLLPFILLIRAALSECCRKRSQYRSPTAHRMCWQQAKTI